MALSKLGLKIIEEANNLKRTKEALAQELNISLTNLEKIIQGNCSLNESKKFIEKMLKKYPIEGSKLLVTESDIYEAFTILNRETSKNSSRVFKRKNSLGKTTNYYEYRDTAMNKFSPIYPEWIKPLVVVKDKNPKNKLICYNKGHILHQFTFFIGEVNFYWKDQSGYHCKTMNTGDSNYIPPFIPHSFASRNKNKLGLIIAVTFADILRFSRVKFSNYSKNKIEEFSGKTNSRLSYFIVFLKNFLNKNFLDEKSILKEMIVRGIDEKSSKRIIDGKKIPDKSETNKLANIFCISSTKLKNIISNSSSKVVNKKITANSKRKVYFDNAFLTIWDLARSNYNNFLNTFIMEVNSKTYNYKILHKMYEYVFNYSEDDILVKVDNKKYILKPEESIIFSPKVAHYFYKKKGEMNSKILIIRVAEEFSHDFTHMYAGLSEKSRKRIFSEVSQWF